MKNSLLSILLFLLTSSFLNAQETEKEVCIYNNSISHPFFDTIQWSYALGISRDSLGNWHEDYDGLISETDTIKQIHTASCKRDSIDWYTIRFCDAKISNDTLILFIHDFTPSTNDNLIIKIYNNELLSSYWTAYPNLIDEEIKWETNKCNLTLNKQNYKKGDTLLGIIEFECFEKIHSPSGVNNRGLITIKGAIKTNIK